MKGCDLAQITGQTWRDFSEITFSATQKIIFGIGRGQVGITVASTHVGKTTFALNCSLLLTSGGAFPPFFGTTAGGMRVMYIDGESTRAELQTDLTHMMNHWSEAECESVKDNLFILCDDEIDGELLMLSNPRHMELVINKARAFKPDLIIVDTMAALFNLYNENDNAEIKRIVFQPLKVLAKEANAAVWLQHHSGKQSEDAKAGNAAYCGRGGSNFGCLARTVVRLINPDRADKERVVLAVPKAKGYRLDDVVIRLNQDSRWFTVVNEPLPTVLSSYQKTLQTVTREMATADIVECGEILGNARRTTEQNLKEAIRKGQLRQVKRGIYAPVETAATATPIGDCGNAENEGSGAVANLTYQ